MDHLSQKLMLNPDVGLRDFCHILTLLPPGASMFHKHMSCLPCDIDLEV